MNKSSKLVMDFKQMLITVIFLPLLLFGQNVNDAVRLGVPGIISNARAIGMGNSNQTQSGDYSAMLFNPAGLALSKNSQFTGSFYHLNLENSSAFFGEENYYNNSSTQFNQLGYMYKSPTTRGSLVYGFGYQKDKDFTSSIEFNGYNPYNNSMIQDLTSMNDDVPYLLGLSYPLEDNEGIYLKDTTNINGRLSQSGSILEEGGINRYSFGAGIEIAKGVYFGGSLNFLSGDYSNNREYYEDDWDNYYTDPTDIYDPNTKNFKTFYVNDIISWDMHAWEFRFGFIVDWMKFIRIGASTKLPTTFYIEENYYLEAYSEFERDYFIDLLPSESKVEYKIKTPLEFSLGASVDLRILNINGQVTFVDYSQMEFSGNLEKSIINQNNKIINANLKSTLNYNLGAELKIPFTEIRARAGIMYYESPYVDDPIEFDRVYLSVGAGIVASDVVKFDIGYSYGFWDTYSDNYGFDQSRVYQSISVHTILLSTTIVY